jgi:hypothetical protein
MSTPQGVAHVEAALELAGNASASIGELQGVDEDWRAEAMETLSGASDLLRGTLDRFYLKTKVCLPFSRRCQEQAQMLLDLLSGLEDPAPEGTEQRLQTAIDALSQAARTLDERSLMQGMAIT